MRVLGISAGNGVNLFPFKKHVIGNIELRSDYTIGGRPYQFKLNFPEAFFSKTLVAEENIDIIIGNPKCGSSSMLALSRGKQFTSHRGEPSLDLFIKGIQQYNPKAFMMENLPRLLDTYSEEDFQALFPNYILTFWVGSMSVLGNSQVNRKRLIITGVRGKNSRLSYRASKWLDTKYRVKVPVHTRELLELTPSNGDFRPPLDEVIALYGGTRMSYNQIQALWDSLKPATRIKTPRESFNTAPGVYRDDADKPPNTIRKSNRCFNPEGLSYTPRERARIQGVPDSFLLLDPREHIVTTEKTLFNKGCTTMGSTPSYEVGLWFYAVIQRAFANL